MDKLGVALAHGNHVAVTWDGSVSPRALEELVLRVQEAVSTEGKVCVEHVERLLMSSLPHSSFHIVLLGLVSGSVHIHGSDVLAEAARILKPGGTVLIQEPVAPESDKEGSLRTPARLSSALKLSGLTEVTQLLQEALTSQQVQTLGVKLGVSTSDVSSVRICGKKPNFEVGSSQPLSFTKRGVPVKPSVDPAAAKLWTLSARDMNDEDLDLLDSDELLDQDDLKKPLPASLRSSGCGEGSEKKRKACKNCTCGLAEELEEEKAKPSTPKNAPSACGNLPLQMPRSDQCAALVDLHTRALAIVDGCGLVMGASMSCRRTNRRQWMNSLQNWAPVSPESCVDINQATEEKLMTLPGINRSLAQSITMHRRKLGGFRRVEDLALVTGLGAERMLALRPEICVGKSTLCQTEAVIEEPNREHKRTEERLAVVMNVTSTGVSLPVGL